MDSAGKIRVDNEKIHCRSCNKQLYGVLIFGQTIPAVRTGFQKFTSVAEQTIKANCPFCGDKAWDKHYDKKTMLSPSEGLYFKSMDQEVVGEVLLTAIEIGRTE